ncbi:caspase-12-like isoform X2 [Sminthopsis crassicaudata]|uniref:caspase-12-like isoform X2 n=1 Tax=Sminthopsis crassicaudata TaxID=9301 RepID=UPI003D68F7EE
MAEQKQNFYPLKIVKYFVSTFVDGVINDLMEKNVLSPNEIKNLGKEFATIMNQGEDLIGIVDHIFQGSKIIMKKMLLLPLEEISRNQSENKGLVPSHQSKTTDHILSVLQNICDSQESFQSFQKRLRSTILNFFKKLDNNAMKAPVVPNQVKLCRLDFYHGLKEAKEGEIYPIMEKGKNRVRLALIICNIIFDYLDERHGAHLDIWGIWKLLVNLGYDVVVKTGVTAQEMESVLKEFADRPEHWSSDSTFLVFMSHGVLNGICGKTHKKQQPDLLYTDTIFQIFNDGNCPSLKENLGITYVMDMSETSANTPRQALQDYSSLEQKQMEKDFILFCSTTPHNVSWRVDILGSIFIKELINCFQKYAWCCHLEEVFRKVQKSFEIPKTPVQMPTIERVSMSRVFYLFPGI